jgi:hypothetical protein
MGPPPVEGRARLPCWGNRADELLRPVDTQQMEDYSKIEQHRFDPEKKAARHKEYFPQDCQKAFEMGRRFAIGA